MDKEYIEKQIPSLYRGIFEKAYKGKRPFAVRAKCLDCCLFQRKEIAACTVVSCPLHKIRPYQVKGSNIGSGTQKKTKDE